MASDRKTQASQEIEALMLKNKELSIVEAILQWGDENDIDIPALKKYIAPALYDKLYEECKANNLILDRNTSASMNEFF